jgi:hypothetical protein
VNSAALGTPCLVPVEVRLAGGASCRGFITRLSPDTAAVSSDPSLEVGSRVTLTFRSPVSGDEVVADGKVTEALEEGGLWRGRRAALVQLENSLEEDVLGSGVARARKHPRRRGSEAAPARASFSGSLQAGLGRRRRTSLSQPAVPLPKAPAPPESDQWRLPGSISDDHTAPPRGGWLSDPEPQESPGVGFSGEEAVPPVRATDPEIPMLSQPEIGAPPRKDDGDDDGEFFGMFGRTEDVPDFMLPQGAEDSSQLGIAGRVSSEVPPDPDRTSEHTDADGYFDPNRSGKIDVPGTNPSGPAMGVGGFGAVSEQDEGATAHADLTADPDFQALLETGSQPDPTALSDQPPVRSTLSVGGDPDRSMAPWEAAPPLRRPDESLIPRNARIASSLPVTFWARGRCYQAIAQNFSKEGLYLAFNKTPPVRGAIVRVEFPIEGDGDSVPIRFNAEVRWQSADRPSSDLPEGFGVQILTFESPKDRRRYDELLWLILSLHESQSARESDPEGNRWSWGSKSRS